MAGKARRILPVCLAPIVRLQCRVSGELPRADLFECMARAGVYVSAARYEPFGLCGLEAALARCALVLSDISSLTELWKGAALFVEPADTRELSATLQGMSAKTIASQPIADGSGATSRTLQRRRNGGSLLRDLRRADFRQAARRLRRIWHAGICTGREIRMRYVIFCHSLASCWNHGNVHFLRGIARELLHRKHEVTVYEPADGWSRTNLTRDYGEAALAEGARVVPGSRSGPTGKEMLDVDEAADRADVIFVHEWTDPDVVTRLGQHRAGGGRYLLFFHDTHHRAVTARDEFQHFDLDGYDAVLAFGEVLRQVYLDHGWGRRAFTWHESADTGLFHPKPLAKEHDLIWIGNWGDGERDESCGVFCCSPRTSLGSKGACSGFAIPKTCRSSCEAMG